MQRKHSLPRVLLPLKKCHNDDSAKTFLFQCTRFKTLLSWLAQSKTYINKCARSFDINIFISEDIVSGIWKWTTEWNAELQTNRNKQLLAKGGFNKVSLEDQQHHHTKSQSLVKSQLPDCTERETILETIKMCISGENVLWSSRNIFLSPPWKGMYLVYFAHMARVHKHVWGRQLSVVYAQITEHKLKFIVFSTCSVQLETCHKYSLPY